MLLQKWILRTELHRSVLVLDSGPDGAGRSPPACVDASIAAGITLKKSRRNLFPLILPSDGAEDGVSFHLYLVGGMKPETHYGYDYYIQRISVRRRAASNENFFLHWFVSTATGTFHRFCFLQRFHGKWELNQNQPDFPRQWKQEKLDAKRRIEIYWKKWEVLKWFTEKSIQRVVYVSLDIVSEVHTNTKTQPFKHS